MKTLPFGAVWAKYSEECNVPADGEWFGEIEAYEKDVLAKSYRICWGLVNEVHHGMFCSGEDFDLTFGLMHTVEKSAEILVKMLSMRPDWGRDLWKAGGRKNMCPLAGMPFSPDIECNIDQIGFCV